MVLLPLPVRADERHDLAGSKLQVDVRDHRYGTARVGVLQTRSRLYHRPAGARRPSEAVRRRLASRVGEPQKPSRDGDSVGARVILGAEVPEREIELRGQNEDRERGFQPDVARIQPQPDADGHECNPQRCGEVEDGSGQE